jgi:hypothetical protein
MKIYNSKNKTVPVLQPLNEGRMFTEDEQGNLKKENTPEQKQLRADKDLPEEINTSLEEMVLTNKSKQFKFDCGAVMGRINVAIKNNFGLNYHYNMTKSVDEFIKSVSDYIATSGNKVSSSDISKLQKQYEKFKK